MAVDWASRPAWAPLYGSQQGHHSVCPPGLGPSTCWGLTHPRARRAGRRQPPEVPGRERERGLGRGRDSERDRGCGTLRWGLSSASRALLAGSGEGPISTRTPVPRHPPPSTLPSFLRTPLQRAPPLPGSPNLSPPPAIPGTPPQGLRSPFPGAQPPEPPPSPSVLPFTCILLFRSSPFLHVRPTPGAHACTAPASTWGF